MAIGTGVRGGRKETGGGLEIRSLRLQTMPYSPRGRGAVMAGLKEK